MDKKYNQEADRCRVPNRVWALKFPEGEIWDDYGSLQGGYEIDLLFESGVETGYKKKTDIR